MLGQMITQGAGNEFSPEEIKRIRQALNESQEAFARRFTVSFTTVNRWETGKTKPQPVHIEQLRRLRDYLLGGRM